MVAETAGTGAIPMLVGGDTSMLYPGVKGIADAHGKGTFGLLHFSAHPDVERDGDHTISDRQALYRLLDQDIVNGSDTVQVGLRGPDVDVESLQWLRDRKVRYHTMAEIQKRGYADVMKRVLREVHKGPDAFFVSIDVSVIDPGQLIASVTNANALLNACLVGIAVRKAGLAPDYVHPLTLDHGQR
jgi:agmatinase